MGLITWIKKKFKILFKKNKAIGYVQIYFKVIGENETYYVAFNGDFGKPLSWLRLQSIKQSTKKFYEKFDKIHSVEFCDKAEYEDNLRGDEISCSWGQVDKIV